jgi:hypothetical protein
LLRRPGSGRYRAGPCTKVTGEAFRDLGESYLDQVSRKRSTTKLVQRLSNLGYDVVLVPKAA